MDLRLQLENCFRSRTCVVGIGNADYGDDAFGVELAKELAAAGMRDVFVADCSPERYLYRLTTGEFKNVLFLDAVDFGADPGFTAFLNAQEIETKFPAISTHKISLGVLARLVEGGGARNVWLLGVQPKTLAPSNNLSGAVAATLRTLKELLLITSNVHTPELCRKTAV